MIMENLKLKLEKWLSGRKRQIANLLYEFFLSYRGFESLFFRKILSLARRNKINSPNP